MINLQPLAADSYLRSTPNKDELLAHIESLTRQMTVKQREKFIELLGKAVHALSVTKTPIDCEHITSVSKLIS